MSRFSQWSDEMAYALGLFYADGSLRPTSRSWYVQFYNTDRPTVEWWHAFIGATNTIHERSSDRENPLYSSRVTDKALGEDLVRLGLIPRKSVVDHDFPQVPEKHLPHFVRGFFDGDGGVWVSPLRKMKGGHIIKVSLTCNAPSFREGLRDVVERVIGKKPSEFGIHLRLSGAEAERSMLWLYEHDGPCLGRKKAVWNDWVQFRRSHGGLISESDPYASLRGLRFEPWHALVFQLPVPEIVQRAGVSRSRVYQVRKALTENRHVA